MDQDVVSKKVFLSSLLICIILLVVLTLSYSIKSPELHICNRDDRLTVILHIPPNNQVLFYPDNTKATIECLTLYMPFYDRKIDVVISNNNASRSLRQLEERYSIGLVMTKGALSFTDGNIYLNRDSGLLETNTTRYQIDKKYKAESHADTAEYKIILNQINKNAIQKDKAVYVIAKENSPISAKERRNIVELQNGKELHLAVH